MRSEVGAISLKSERRGKVSDALRGWAWCWLACGLTLLLAGCGGGTPTTPAQSPNVTTFMQDAPADGVAAFNITLNSASLQGSGGHSLPLTTSGPIEVRHLDLAPTVSLQASASQKNTYNSLNLSLSAPQLTVVDVAGKVIAVNGATTPSARLTTTNISLPVQVSVGPNDHVALLLDFDLEHSISVDANGNYVVNPVLTATVQSAPMKLEGVFGMVTAIFFNGSNILSQVPINALGQSTTSQNLFQLRLLDSGQVVSVAADSGTLLDPKIGNFSSLRLGQLINLSAEFQSNGTFLATSIAAGPPTPSLRYQGPVTAVQRDGSGNVSLGVVVQN